MSKHKLSRADQKREPWQTMVMIGPGTRLEKRIGDAVTMSGGKYRSVRGFVEAAGIKSPRWSQWKKKADEKGVKIPIDMITPIAQQLNVSPVELFNWTHGTEPTDSEPFPNRAWAARTARDMGISELAISTVLSDQAKSDGTRHYWFKRIETEELNCSIGFVNEAL